MEEMRIDTGMKEYRVNGGGVLRFNPSDPNVYSRFLEAAEAVRRIEEKMGEEAEQAAGDGRKALALLCRADREAKAELERVFGPENDLDALLGGVNLMAVCANGERVVTNLFAAIGPVIEEGAEAFLQAKAAKAVAEAQARRAARQAPEE